MLSRIWSATILNASINRRSSSFRYSLITTPITRNKAMSNTDFKQVQFNRIYSPSALHSPASRNLISKFLVILFNDVAI